MSINAFGEHSFNSVNTSTTTTIGLTDSDVRSSYLRLDGTTQPTANINMNQNQILNSKATQSSDNSNVVATKGYVDSNITSSHTTAGANYLRLDGTTQPTANINMNQNQIINSKATKSSDNSNVVATKGYVDSSITASHTTADTTNDSKFLLKSGGQMTGSLDMNTHKINGVKDPDSTGDQQCASTVKWVNDHFVHKKMNTTLTSSTFSNVLDASLNLNNNRLFGLPYPLIDSDAIPLSYFKSHVYTQLSETLLWEYYTKFGNAIYRIDRGLPTEVVADSTTQKVSKLYDQSLYENHAEQTTAANQPTLCTSALRNNNRYYLNFSGSERLISNINLNPGVGEQDIVNVFIVYKLTSFTGTYWTRNGLFGHDNSGFDKFVSFGPSGDLVVAGATNDHIVIGLNTVNGKTPITTYQTNANAGELNKWCCLSIHWNVPGGTNKSSVWCNGKKLCDFTARTSVGSTQMTFGDLNPNGIAGLKGSISFFALYKNRVITDPDIKLHHHVLCQNWYKITHDAISF